MQGQHSHLEKVGRNEVEKYRNETQVFKVRSHLAWVTMKSQIPMEAFDNRQIKLVAEGWGLMSPTRRCRNRLALSNMYQSGLITSLGRKHLGEYVHTYASPHLILAASLRHDLSTQTGCLDCYTHVNACIFRLGPLARPHSRTSRLNLQVDS